MPTWNPQQLKAISTKQKNILVSASAGAGKTTVLIARLVDLVIQDRIGIDHILAMTFTEAAANEMKKRLASELHSLYQRTTDEQERMYISEQLTAISTAHISTIHSFCLSILQEFYYVLGLSAKRVETIMDTAASLQANEQAMQEVFAIQYQKQEEAFYALASMFSARAESDDALRSAITSLATTANAQSDPDAWLSSCVSQYQAYRSINEMPEAITSMYFDSLSVQLLQYEAACKEVLLRYTTLYMEEDKKHTLMEKKCAALPSLHDALAKREYTAYRDAFIAICHIVVPTSPDKEDLIYTRLRKQIQAIEDDFLANAFDESILLQDIEHLAPRIQKLVEMCQDYRRIYASIKEKQECIDFDDMEHFALAILKANDHQVAKHYQDLFDEIMVDEFQDSNDVQNELVNLICRENNVFRVGDIKQSIYGFRHARPQLMRGLIEQSGPLDEVIYLSNNYRSKKMIVDFNNQLFMELMNLDGFDCSYRKEDDVETGIPAQLEDNYPTVFHAIDLAAIKEESGIPMTTNEVKASYIANQILTIRESQNRQWKDFVVLVRANARKEDMKKVFDELHIPYFIDVKSGFYESNAVQIILSTLRALLNPYDEIQFAACMLSPLFQLSVQELADCKRKKTGSYYDYLKEIEHPAMAVFEELKSYLYQMSICEMLTALFEVHDYYARHTTNQEKTNLDQLFENAANFEEKEGKGIYAFMKSIDASSSAQTAEAIPIGSDEDVVRVMSIHQSKGLQFPVVFLWSNSKQTPIEFKELFVCDSDFGIGLKYMDIEHRYVRSTIHRKAIEHKKDREELEEEMRILYVATTRAQQQMHVVDCITCLEDYEMPLSTTSVYQRGGYTSWILTAALAKGSKLFNIKPVTHMWDSPIQEEMLSRAALLGVYEGRDTAIEFLTPSSAKEGMQIPSLVFGEQKAMQHGTQLHAWIERLQAPSWSEKDILAMDPSISKQDLTALLQLGASPFYQAVYRYPEVHHEFPFMVKQGSKILHGFLDFVAIGQDIIIIDFKSDYAQEEASLLALYQDQLKAYADAMRILYPNKQVKAYIYSLALHKEIVVHV